MEKINGKKYGLVKADCKGIPCALELIYYEFGAYRELINPGQAISTFQLDKSLSFDSCF
ncbi:hypothetical protein [Shivajiella indica]|uniref:hypothetical protein n=1 Tax=Shivajiella indica TaxID=872115 RepID=UPI0036D43171